MVSTEFPNVSFEINLKFNQALFYLVTEYERNETHSAESDDSYPSPTVSVNTITKCTAPPSPANGYTMPIRKQFFYVGQTVTFRCYPPMYLTGEKIARCLESGFFEDVEVHCNPGN